MLLICKGEAFRGCKLSYDTRQEHDGVKEIGHETEEVVGRARTETSESIQILLLSSHFPFVVNTIQARIMQNKTKRLLEGFSPWAVSFQPLELISNDLSSNILVLSSYLHFTPKFSDHGPPPPLIASSESVDSLDHLVFPDLCLTVSCFTILFTITYYLVFPTSPLPTPSSFLSNPLPAAE